MCASGGVAGLMCSRDREGAGSKGRTEDNVEAGVMGACVECAIMLGCGSIGRRLSRFCLSCLGGLPLLLGVSVTGGFWEVIGGVRCGMGGDAMWRGTEAAGDEWLGW